MTIGDYVLVGIFGTGDAAWGQLNVLVCWAEKWWSGSYLRSEDSVRESDHAGCAVASGVEQYRSKG